MGCAAGAGIALTERGKAQAVTFVTGHGTQGEPELDWAGLASLGQTICIYMGLSRLEQLRRRLMAAGLAGTTPAALIEKGSLPEQRVFRATLEELPGLAQRHQLEGPAMVLIGEVAREAASQIIGESFSFDAARPHFAAEALAG